MIAEDRLEQRLRRSANDVRSAIVQRATPPPFGTIDEGRPTWLRAAVAVVVVAGLWATALVVAARNEHSSSRATDELVAIAPSPCGRVVALVALLERPPTDREGWRHVGTSYDELTAAIDDGVADVTGRSDLARRLDRFLLLAGIAVAKGAGGQLLVADSRAVEAAAVGRDLLRALDQTDCGLPEPADA